MSRFTTLRSFVREKLITPGKDVHICGIDEAKWPFIQNQINLCVPTACQLFIFDSQDKAEYYHDLLEDKLEQKILLYPANDSSQYEGYVQSDFNLFERFKVLASLAFRDPTDQGVIVLTSLDAARSFVPINNFFHNRKIELSITDIVAPRDLAQKLVDIGYRRSVSVEERGTFDQKGEIFDLFPLNHSPVRIHYFDEMIEEIFGIDLSTQRTQRQCPYEKITIPPCPNVFLSPQFSTTLRKYIPKFGPTQKLKESAKKEVFDKLKKRIPFESYSIYGPLFLEDRTTLFDYFSPQSDIIHIFNATDCEQNFTHFIEKLEEEYQRVSQDFNNSCILPDPKQFYSIEKNTPWSQFKTIYIDRFSSSSKKQDNHFNLALEPAIPYLKKTFPHLFNEQNYLASTIRAIIACSEYNKKITIVFAHDSTKNEIEHLLSNMIDNPESYHSRNINFCPGFLDKGFYYYQEDSLFLSESDFFHPKRKKAVLKGTSKNVDLFAEQISSLNTGDYIIHKEYGIGIYRGLETLDIGGVKGDFLVLHYQDQDKIYVPVYKIGLVQKYADHSTKVTVASLKNNKFNQVKKRARESAKKLAFNLLQIQAEREKHQSHCFSPPDDLFKEFEFKFPFKETPDQLAAIEDVLNDMQRQRPMDRLICGDVGFGKTEVAMRAAFKAVQDSMQVVILVPTTILALQHYRSFQKRFRNFSITIDFLSRFKSIKESREIITKANSGQIDILIGTHKILSDKLTFKNLGLLVIDEEQRFGVSHKEKVKAMRTSIDVLSLTATPIPRTLQLAFLGIRDLSLIQTAPPKRQSIKTHIIKHSDEIIKKAIQNELNRGGQIFFVHNRVRDIQKIANYIKDLIPSIQMAIAHGQLPEKELEQRMNDFYNHQYDLLLSTTIIESGLDIPSANTMIINRADSYGLAQLHQLRGRVGRSERKAYAYFIIPNGHGISEIASQRLQALQTYADMGAGFSIASSDLEIRGGGDILGAEQSGHIEAVGLETYMELLKEAIREIKGEAQSIPQNIEIQTPFSCFIPQSYICNSKERLKTYKRLANVENESALQSIQLELQDRFGLFPIELSQLFQLISIQLILKPLGIEKIKVAGKILELKFSKEFINENTSYQNKIVRFFTSQSKKYIFNKDYSVSRTFQSTITIEKLSTFSQEVAEQIILC